MEFISLNSSKSQAEKQCIQLCNVPRIPVSIRNMLYLGMARKKWTANEEVTDELLKFREKRKWQLALRRYVMEKKATASYAPYFGIDVNGFREWFELQFTNGLNWDNYAQDWQFNHIVPIIYFDFDIEEDLKLCWNFINIRVERLDLNKNKPNSIDILAVRPYFEDLNRKTNYGYCQRMLDKITQIENTNLKSNSIIENFLISNKTHFETIDTLTEIEFEKLNQGISVNDILLEREILKKFGS